MIPTIRQRMALRLIGIGTLMFSGGALDLVRYFGAYWYLGVYVMTKSQQGEP